jgi:hypothetical protein
MRVWSCCLSTLLFSDLKTEQYLIFMNSGKHILLELLRGGVDGICHLAQKLAAMLWKWLLQNRISLLMMPSTVLRAFLTSRLGQAVALVLTSLLCVQCNINISKPTSSLEKGVLADVKSRVQLLFGLLDMTSHWVLNLRPHQLGLSSSEHQETSETSDDSAVRLFCSPDFERQVLAFLADHAGSSTSTSSATPKGTRGSSQDEHSIAPAPLKPPWLTFPIEIRRATGSDGGGHQLKKQGSGIIVTDEQADGKED